MRWPLRRGRSLSPIDSSRSIPATLQTKRGRALSYPVYQDLAARSDLFDGLLAHNMTVVGIGEGGESRRTFSGLVSANFFDVLGVPMLQGRGFTADESTGRQQRAGRGCDLHLLEAIGFDPALIGKTIRVNERAFTIVGITPQGFTGTMPLFGPELFFPLGVFDTLSNDSDGDTSRRAGSCRRPQPVSGRPAQERHRADCSQRSARRSTAAASRRASPPNTSISSSSPRPCPASGRTRRRRARPSSRCSPSSCSA